jgi:hypothetical protein
MRKEIKNYYETNFGSFTSIRASEIKELSVFESWLRDLPGTISFNENTDSPSSLTTRKYLHAQIKKAFDLSQN